MGNQLTDMAELGGTVRVAGGCTVACEPLDQVLGIMIAKLQPANEAQGGVIMTEREAQLRTLGVAVGQHASDVLTGMSTVGSASLTGYGTFTPITVRPYTMPKNAQLERDQ